MGGKSSAPAAPNYTAAAEATAQSANDQATRNTWANRPTINTPFGSSSYTATSGTDPATGLPINNWVNNITLSPAQQAALDQQQQIGQQRSTMASGLLGQANAAYHNSPDYSNLTQMFGFGGPAQFNTSGGPSSPVFNQMGNTPMMGRVGAAPSNNRVWTPKAASWANDFNTQNQSSAMDYGSPVQDHLAGTQMQTMQAMPKIGEDTINTDTYPVGGGSVTPSGGSGTPPAGTGTAPSLGGQVATGGAPSLGGEVATGGGAQPAQTGSPIGSFQSLINAPQNRGAGPGAPVGDPHPAGPNPVYRPPDGATNTSGPGTTTHGGPTFQNPAGPPLGVGPQPTWNTPGNYVAPSPGNPGSGGISPIGTPNAYAPTMDGSQSNFDGGRFLNQNPGTFSPLQRSQASDLFGFGGAQNMQRYTGAGRGMQDTIGNGGRIQTNVGGPGQYSQGAADAIQQRQEPLQSRQRAQLDQQLANQGITLGSEAWKNAHDDLGRQENDARLAAITAGYAQGNTEFGQGIQQGQFRNAAQAQNFGQGLQQGQFANTAQAQRYGQQFQQTGANNQNINTDFANRNTTATNNNSALGQMFNMQNTANNQNNQVSQQELDNQSSAIRAANANEQQRFANRNTATATNNAATQQEFQNQMEAMRFNNSAAQQGFTNSQAQIAAANAARSSQQSANQSYGAYQQQQRAQQIQEMMNQRNLPLNEMNALLTGQQIGMPTFGNAPNATATGGQGANYLGAAQNQYNGSMDAFSAQQAQNNSQNQALASAASMAAMFFMSDERLKENINQVGSLNDGTPTYSWDWKDGSGSSVGVLAQEVEKKHPDAVITTPSGFKAVNYAAIIRRQRGE